MDNTIYTICVKHDRIRVLNIVRPPAQKLILYLNIKRPATQFKIRRAFHDKEGSIYRYECIVDCMSKDKFWPIFHQKDKVKKYSAHMVLKYILKHLEN